MVTNHCQATWQGEKVDIHLGFPILSLLFPPAVFSNFPLDTPFQVDELTCFDKHPTRKVTNARIQSIRNLDWGLVRSAVSRTASVLAEHP